VAPPPPPAPTPKTPPAPPSASAGTAASAVNNIAPASAVADSQLRHGYDRPFHAHVRLSGNKMPARRCVFLCVL
jgi:hypothetical protein